MIEARVIFEANQIKSLIALAEERGIATAFSLQDVNELISNNEISPFDKLGQLNRWHKSVHELLYTPPVR